MADVSTQSQREEQMKQQAQQAAGQTKEEAKMAAQESAEAIKQGYERLKERKRPFDAAMTVTENVPSGVYLGLAGGSLLLSIILYGFRKKEDAIFVGHWVPSFLVLGLFSKFLISREPEHGLRSE